MLSLTRDQEYWFGSYPWRQAPYSRYTFFLLNMVYTLIRPLCTRPLYVSRTNWWADSLAVSTVPPYWGSEIRGASRSTQISHCSCCCFWGWVMGQSWCPSRVRWVEGHNRSQAQAELINFRCVKFPTAALLGYGWKLLRSHNSILLLLIPRNLGI